MPLLSRRSSVFLAKLLAVGACSIAAPRFSAADEPAVPGAITVHPATIALRHQRQPHSLQVLGGSADGYSLDLRPQAKFVSADPKIATVDAGGWVRPVANGQTQVTVTVAGADADRAGQGAAARGRAAHQLSA